MPILQAFKPPLHRNFVSAPTAQSPIPCVEPAALRPGGLAWKEAQRTSNYGRANRNGAKPIGFDLAQPPPAPCDRCRNERKDDRSSQAHGSRPRQHIRYLFAILLSLVHLFT